MPTSLTELRSGTTSRMRGLYAIIDVSALDSRGVDVFQFARQVLAARPAALQLRAKTLGARETLRVLRALKPLCVAEGVPLFANDRPDLAKMASCDGVHVGQDDLAIGDVRRFAPELKVGISTHDEMQLRVAVAAAPDYVAFGPVFATASKERPDPVVGVEGLSRAARIVAKRIPLVAIGGIDLERAPLIAPIADAGAVIAALLPPDEATSIEARARALHRALGGV